MHHRQYLHEPKEQHGGEIEGVENSKEKEDKANDNRCKCRHSEAYHVHELSHKACWTAHVLH